MALEHKVATSITGLLDGKHLQRPFDHTEQCIISARVGALRAQGIFTQGPAPLTVAYALHRRHQRLRQAHTAMAITLQQLQRHTLRSLLPDTGENAQRIDQLANQRAEAHGKLPINKDYCAFLGATATGSLRHGTVLTYTVVGWAIRRCAVQGASRRGHRSLLL